ncbi:MAG: hypothetical protein NVS4B11_26260 [Ktedonobacteraceae bacterium]
MKEIEPIDSINKVQPPKKPDPLVSSPNRQKVFRALLIQRWAAILGILSFGVLYLFLSDKLIFNFFPRWLPLLVEGILVLPFVYGLLMRRHLPQRLLRTLGFLLAGVATLALVASITLLLVTLPQRVQSQSISLVRDATILWISNILVFGLWFWEIDGGGPLKRHQAGHKAADFLFPQQMNGNTEGWAPHFIDYVFLAFNTATAFSPTDTPPLSRPAKVLMMVESIISLVIVAGLAARAINILGG